MPKTLQLIQTITVGSGGATSIDFQNIPQNYTDLVLKISARTNRANLQDAVSVYFNNDTTAARYTMRNLYGTGASPFTTSTNTYLSELVMTTGANATASTFGSGEIYIPNYAGSTQKSASADGVGENNSTSSYVGLSAYLYNQTTAISRITIIPVTGTSISQYSTAALYGIGGAKASGGTITYDSTYTYHTFTSTGTFLPLEKIKNAEVICVSGGGGGGCSYGGGGGAGGLLYAIFTVLNAGTTYSAVIGSGGSAGGTSSVPGNGTSSVFATLTPTGGGGGGSYNSGNAGANGGSGGGSGSNGSAGGAWLTAGTGITGQGFGGGTSPYTIAAGAGGGGAGAVGGSTTTAGIGGDGGTGTTAYTAWNQATNTGVLNAGLYYIAGGGGGGSTIGGGAGTRGGNANGGGGNGSHIANTNGTNGTANTGGGGGGSGYYTSSAVGGSGGSGLIIVRYPTD